MVKRDLGKKLYESVMSTFTNRDEHKGKTWTSYDLLPLEHKALWGNIIYACINDVIECPDEWFILLQDATEFTLLDPEEEAPPPDHSITISQSPSLSQIIS